MKKTAISLAVAAAMTASFAAQADTTLYGRIGQAINYTDTDDILEDSLDIDGNWDVSNFTSRWGLKGSEDLGNGLKAVYRYEWTINTEGDNSDDFSRRLAYVGLEGGFGSLRLGQQWTPYYNATGAADIMNMSGYNVAPSVFRKDNAVVYQTPDLGGFEFEVMANMDGEDGEDGVDGYNARVGFSAGGFGVGVAFLSDEVADTDLIGAAISYSGGPFYAAASFHTMDNDNADDGDVVYVAGTYDLGGGNKILAQWGFADPENGEEQNDVSVGFQHDLGKRTHTYIEYNDLEDVRGQLRIGLRTDF